MQDFLELFEQEARRLRLNMYRLPGLAATGTGWETSILERMRSLEPGATWQDVFPDMAIPDPEPELADAIAAVDADPEAFWRERELSRLFWREFHRLVPLPQQGTDAQASGIGFSLPDDTDYALQILRSLPDGAGWAAFRDALQRQRSHD